MKAENQEPGAATGRHSSLPRWALVLIILLAGLVILQGGFFLYYLTKGGAVKTQPTRAELLLPRPDSAPQAVPRQAAALPFAWQSRAMMQDPFAAMRRMEDQMNQLMGGFFTRPAMGTGSSSMSSFDFMPTIDIEDKNDSYLVTADLPGLDKDKINVTVRDGYLMIQGVRKSSSESRNEDRGFYAQERSYGSFARSVPLPGPVDEANIQASYVNGVLQVKLPKTAGQTPRKIAIQ